MRRFWHRLNDSSGSVLIFVALSIFFLAAVTILAVDISKLLVTRGQLQNAADAGALAGAEMFLDTPVPEKATIEARSDAIAQSNRSYTDSEASPVDLVSDTKSEAFTDQADTARYGIVTCVTRSVVSQYFTAIPVSGNVAKADKKGNVAAIAAARAGEAGCTVQCLKPWSIPDRWDDETLIPGTQGWANNGSYDREKFNDLNNNGFHDPNEPWQDGVSDYNANKGAKGALDGVYNQEFYSPLITGYMAWKDLGLELTLKAGSPSGASSSSQYYPIDLPIPGSGSTGAARYRWNIANCNPTFMGPGDIVSTENGTMAGPTAQGMRDLINQDPGAYWDGSCTCVKSQYGDASPRIVFIPLHDPRNPLEPGKQVINISKIAAFYIESVRSNGDVTGRFVRVQSPNAEICPPGQHSGGFLYTITLVDPSLAR